MKSYFCKTAFLLIVIGLFGLAASQWAEAQYSLIDLGLPSGSTSGEPRGINASGQVVGFCTDASGSYRALLWQNGAITDLGTLGGSSAIAVAINAGGHIDGEAMTASGSLEIFFYADGVMQDTGVSAAGWYVTGINNQDEVVGEDGNWKAFLLSNGVFEELGTLGGSTSGAASINNAGQVVGVSETSNSGSYGSPFVWQNGTMTALPLWSGASIGVAYQINASGQIVGYIGLPEGHVHGSIWPDPNSTPIDMDTLGGATSSAVANNNLGVVVGAADPSIGMQHATIWDSVHGLKDLNALIPANSGWVLDAAFAINDNGIIAARGFGANNVIHPILLVPDALKSVTVSPTTIAGSLNATGKLTLSSPAPLPITVKLASSDPVAAPPASVTIPTGASSATFPIETSAVASRHTCVITAAFGGNSKSAKLTVRPIGVQALYIVPNSVLSGDNAIGVVTLEARAAPGPITVTLTSSDPSVAQPVDSSGNPLSNLTIPAGTRSAAFYILTGPVSVTTVVTLSATANGITKKATLTVTP